MKEKINKLVIIDDDPIHNFIAKRALDKFEIAKNIRIFNNPADAIDFFEDTCLNNIKEHCPELVLLDFEFPTMNAIEMLKKVKGMGLDLQSHFVIIIVSTIEIRNEAKQALEELGVNAFLTKPITEETINSLMENH